MDNALLVIFLFGLLLTYTGGMIVFTDRGLEWMYKKQIWNRKDNLFNEREKRKFDRQVRGGAFFLTGLLIVIGTIVVVIVY